ncbi:MAG: hypothetical protein AMJ88_00615 [Anaerolineae bacterium SM23_ 63]|nr:MAG: hypothetical protein AMJ88_00615 [Anaerolineae bacterium SM23_ 63]HEY45767.1 hypothetical protein [Anaerolineae bacterium]
MKRSTIDKLNRQVTRQFPEMKGVQPNVQLGPLPKDGSQRFTLTYKGKAELPGGRKLSRIVRVVSDESGHILRISTSK